MKTFQRTPVKPAAAPGPGTAGTSNRELAPAESVAPAPTPATAVRPRASHTMGRAAIVVAVGAMCVVAALALAWQHSRRVVSATANTQPEALAPPSEFVAVQPAVLPAPVAAAAPAAAATRPRVARTVIEKPKQVPVTTTTRTAPADFAPPLKARESAATAVDLHPTSSASAAPNLTPDSMSHASVTITGCLETIVNEDRFRLTDIEGADAPKGRSWRSGFLKRRPAPVELVELPDPSGLRKYVGHRVMATGLLTSRELRVRSLEPAGVSCN
jgi:hypothetical protein